MEEYVAKSILKKELNISNLHAGIIDALQNIIDEIPPADVEEVVRCKNCRAYETAEYDGGIKHVCRLYQRQMQEDDFCSYGEKRDKENENAEIH